MTENSEFQSVKMMFWKVLFYRMPHNNRIRDSQL